ncbi:hypothetical protein QQ045_008543 [Rhodiola kirilowii]
MHCFRIPKGVLRRYQSLIKRFWWSGKQGSKTVHWLKYNLLCETKENGGLGFRDLHVLNQAFLAKQGWRIFSHPDLLLSTVIKVRYFNGTDLFSACLGHRPSQCWRGIYSALDLLRACSSFDNTGARFWAHSSDGHYTVRSGYDLLSVLHKQSTISRGETSNPSITNSFWKAFWRLPVPRKIKLFGWRCFYDALSVDTNLYVRNINISCPVCNYKVES